MYSIRVHNIIIHTYLAIVHRAWTTRSYVGTFCKYTYLFHLKEDARNHNLSARNNNIFVHDYIDMAINRLVFGPKTAVSTFPAVYIYLCCERARTCNVTRTLMRVVRKKSRSHGTTVRGEFNWFRFGRTIIAVSRRTVAYFANIITTNHPGYA